MRFSLSQPPKNQYCIALYFTAKINTHFVVLARSAFPSSPARFVGRFSCRCIGELRPRRDRGRTGITGRGNACKTMHPVDAWLNSGKIAVFSGIFGGATCRPVPCAGGNKSGSVRGCIFPDYPPAKPRQA